MRTTYVNGLRLGPPSARKTEGWRAIVRSETETVKAVRLAHATFRLAGVIPTWTSYMLTQHYGEMRRHLDPDMVRKVRAWWELMFECGDTAREPGSREFAYCRTFLLCEALRRRHGRFPACDARKFVLSEERAGVLRDAVLARYEDLVRR